MNLVTLSLTRLCKVFVFSPVLILLLLYSCKSQKSSDSIPSAISKQISVFSNESTCKDAKVNEFKFQDQLVYVFEEGTCRYDKEINVYDRNGKLIGSLGGFAGNTIINGDDFNSAVLQRTVWQKQ